MWTSYDLQNNLRHAGLKMEPFGLKADSYSAQH